nr:MAG TPA: hypothetical protein [Caudoviricetes sp.]
MPISSEALEITSSKRSTRERPTTSPDGRRGNKPRNGINLKFEYNEIYSISNDK